MNVLTDTSATEKDATNAKGYYIFDLAQAETNGDKLTFSAKSATANVVVIAVPPVVYTYPATGILAPATAGRTLVVDAAGLADSNVVKVGPTGTGTAQTAKDLGAINVTNLNTLSGHDPGAALGTSTLTQAQVTGGAYSVQSALCVLGDARIANLDAAVSSRMATYTQPTGFLATNFPATLASPTNITQATGIDVTKWGGTAIATPNTPGVPIVDTRRLVRQGTAQATGNSTTAIKLDAGASGTNDFYKHMLVQVISGTGAPQMGMCTAYNGGTKIATISPAWPTAPDNTSVFQIQPAMVDPVVAVNANLTQILGMALSESNGGNLALAVSSFFDVGTTASRCDFISQVHFVDEVTGDVGGDVVGSIHALTGAAIDSIWQDALGGGGFTGPSTIGKLLKDFIDVAISSRAATGDAMTLTAAYDFAKGTSAMAESYAANGQQPTPQQALYAIHQMLMQFAISGTAIQVKKLDNSTTAFIVTMNDASNPTSAVRI